MKPFTLSTDSLHWRLAGYYGPLYQHKTHNIDMCSYGRAMLRGMFIVLLITFVCCLVSAACGSTLGWVAAMIAMRQYIAPEQVATIVPIFLAVCVAFAIWCGMEYSLTTYLRYRRDQRRNKWEEATIENPEVDSAFRVWYRSFKDKTCVQLTFVNHK